MLWTTWPTETFCTVSKKEPFKIPLMKNKHKARATYLATMKEIGYVPRKKAAQADYDRIGFKSGLEVHQQLNTSQKLFCRCPSGIYQSNDDFDAEVIRHMRPTLSELGEYDGTALMEFKTRKEIIYRLKNQSTCTYEVDDTPPFPINREAVDFAIKISHLKRLNIVGELHITRKQYLDGSIPTGFQRTGIIGVEGEIELKGKKVRLIQLSLEEDSCREVSDVGHTRIYKTDRLGMPLIETVTYPDMVNPNEVAEACQVIRFMNRSSGLVRTGIGAARQDVNVSCRGGTRVEIKGVSRIKWIPELTHNEAFRQWALLNIRNKLLKKIKKPNQWHINFVKIEPSFIDFKSPLKKKAKENGYEMYAAALPGFDGLLSHFTQPGRTFADEFSDRLKVIACIEKPNFTCSESLAPIESDEFFALMKKLTGAKANDAVVVFWGPHQDMATAGETIQERCRIAFEGVPNETRKSFGDGTTVFERVLPGADRMYPDTDSPPIPLDEKHIRGLSKDLPVKTIEMFHKMQNWGIPEDTFTYILKNNLFEILEQLIDTQKLNPVFAATLLGHKLRHAEGRQPVSKAFRYNQIVDLVKECQARKLHLDILHPLLPLLLLHPNMDFDSLLVSINFKKIDPKEIISGIKFLKNKYQSIGRKLDSKSSANWTMGQLRPKALGNMSLAILREAIEEN